MLSKKPLSVIKKRPTSTIDEHNEAVSTAQESFNEKRIDSIEQFGALESELEEKLETLESDFSNVEEESNNQKETLEFNLDSLAESVTTASPLSLLRK